MKTKNITKLSTLALILGAPVMSVVTPAVAANHPVIHLSGKTSTNHLHKNQLLRETPGNKVTARSATDYSSYKLTLKNSGAYGGTIDGTKALAVPWNYKDAIATITDGNGKPVDVDTISAADISLNITDPKGNNLTSFPEFQNSLKNAAAGDIYHLTCTLKGTGGTSAASNEANIQVVATPKFKAELDANPNIKLGSDNKYPGITKLTVNDKEIAAANYDQYLTRSYPDGKTFDPNTAGTYNIQYNYQLPAQTDAAGNTIIAARSVPLSDTIVKVTVGDNQANDNSGGSSNGSSSSDSGSGSTSGSTSDSNQTSDSGSDSGSDSESNGSDSGSTSDSESDSTSLPNASSQSDSHNSASDQNGNSESKNNPQDKDQNKDQNKDQQQAPTNNEDTVQKPVQKPKLASTGLKSTTFWSSFLTSLGSVFLSVFKQKWF